MKFGNSGKALGWVILIVLLLAVLVNAIAWRIFAVAALAGGIGIVWLVVLMLIADSDACEIEQLQERLVKMKEDLDRARIDRDEWNGKHYNAEQTSAHRKAKIEEQEQELSQQARRIKTLEKQEHADKDEIKRLTDLCDKQNKAIVENVKTIGDLRQDIHDLEESKNAKPAKPPKRTGDKASEPTE